MSAKHSHTPGPWRDVGLDDDDYYSGQITATIKEGLRTRHIDICKVDQDKYLGQRDDEDNEYRANARLIAAAPEMLGLLYSWRAAMTPKSYPDDKNLILKHLILDTDAVIAKAEGRR